MFLDMYKAISRLSLPPNQEFKYPVWLIKFLFSKEISPIKYHLHTDISELYRPKHVSFFLEDSTYYKKVSIKEISVAVISADDQ